MCPWLDGEHHPPEVPGIVLVRQQLPEAGEQLHPHKESAGLSDLLIRKVFYDNDNEKRTFEIVLEACNTALCAELFGQDAVKYMLNNKTEAAFTLLTKDIVVEVPDYIKRAIAWIRE